MCHFDALNSGEAHDSQSQAPALEFTDATSCSVSFEMYTTRAKHSIMHQSGQALHACTLGRTSYLQVICLKS